MCKTSHFERKQSFCIVSMSFFPHFFFSPSSSNSLEKRSHPRDWSLWNGVPVLWSRHRHGASCQASAAWCYERWGLQGEFSFVKTFTFTLNLAHSITHTLLVWIYYICICKPETDPHRRLPNIHDIFPVPYKILAKGFRGLQFINYHLNQA